ncbi:DUF2934 domain-containing protein [Methylobacterium sp. P1-11]|uniref:DUF2934 domain-containing protein n=1 Tax=Methylobacterium sp. P1-11 TaxID=2024616 RepID=UPI0011EC8237|nr:DUF2934 domain-containing protein [Methylobacterium sp. P1-11]
MDVPPDFRAPPDLPAAGTTLPEPATGPDEAAPQPPAPSPDAITFEQIRERAYELWERNHRPEGFEIEFWLLAERELRKERDRRKGGEAPTAPRSDAQPT